jgi:hypothetical protein
MTPSSYLSTALVGAVFTLAAACTPDDARPTADGSPSPSRADKRAANTTPSPTSPSVQNAVMFGPHGVGPLRLGMTHQEVVNTGAGRSRLGAGHDGWPPACRVLWYGSQLLGREIESGPNGALSPRQGLEKMYATPGMVTPHGIRLGSTLQEVREALDRPGLDDGELVTVPASDRAVYGIQIWRVVTSISLTLRQLDCNR